MNCFRNIFCFVFLTSWFLCNAQLNINFCITNGAPFATYSQLQNNTSWGGYLVGFCEDLFNPTDQIIPLSNIGCAGELGNLTLVRRAMGTLSSRCRKSVGKFMCYLFLPKYRNNALNPVALPCTNDQANTTNENPNTLLSWIKGECGETAFKQLAAGGFDLAFQGIDEQLADDSFFLRASCRVVDEGDNERDDDSHPNWRPEFGCPEPLRKINTIDDNDLSLLGCGFPCPGPLYTEEQWNQFKVIFNYVNPITFCLCLISVIRLWQEKDQQKFPRVLIFLLCAVSLPIQIGASVGFFFVLSGKDHEDLWCENEYTPQTNFWSFCAFQGFMIQYFAKVGVCIWISIIFNLYITIVHENQMTELYERYYYVFAFAYPTVYTISALILGKYDYTLGSSWCFISGSDDGLYQYVLFYMDFFAFVLVGAYFTAHILYFIVKARMSMASGNSKAVLFSFKTFMFLGFMFAVFVSVAYGRIEGSFSADEITDSITEWVTCVIVTYIATNETFVDEVYTVNKPDYSLCELKKTPNFPPIFTATLLMCSAGFMVFSLFGVRSSDFRFINRFINRFIKTQSVDETRSYSSNKGKGGNGGTAKAFLAT